MSYSQYGGVAFRAGQRVDDRSDAMLTPDLRNLGTPGCIPDALTAGLKTGDFAAISPTCVRAHVVLGDGPVFVSLNKTTWFDIHVLENGVFRDLDDVELAAHGIDLPSDIVTVDEDGEDAGKTKLDRWPLTDMEGHEGKVRFEVLGHVVEYRMMRVRGYAQHVRLTQPDGTVWSGFSGSEIGFGYDDEDTAPHLERHATAFD